MRAKPTTGSWRMGPGLGEVCDAEDRVVCDVYHPDDEVADAETRLIVAAPDLLAACEALLEAQRRAGTGEPDAFGLYHDAVELARAAVSRARGSE